MEKLTMTIGELSALMGLSMPKAYELSERSDFPCIRIGRRKVIPVDAFKRWLDGQVNERIDKPAQKV